MRAARYSLARRAEAAWILDVCASSRRDRDPDRDPLPSLFTGFVSTTDAQQLVHAHWRSFELASHAFYATCYAPGSDFGDFLANCAEAACLLREGTRLYHQDDHPLWWWDGCKPAIRHAASKAEVPLCP
jgi:hypothetical protein